MGANHWRCKEQLKLLHTLFQMPRYASIFRRLIYSRLIYNITHQQYSIWRNTFYRWPAPWSQHIPLLQKWLRTFFWTQLIWCGSYFRYREYRYTNRYYYSTLIKWKSVVSSMLLMCAILYSPRLWDENFRIIKSSRNICIYSLQTIRIVMDIFEKEWGFCTCINQ